MTLPTALSDAIVGFGAVLDAALITKTAALFVPLHRPVPSGQAGTIVTEDVAYGPDPRHRLDLFQPGNADNRPVLLFAGGGGLMVDAMRRGSPLRGNVGLWAARNRLLGVTMTYRLAPRHQWPAGARDVADAIGWLQANAARYGGNPSQIFVVGHSAGAGHVATAIAKFGRDAPAGRGIAGAVLISGLYDLLTLPNGPNKAYFGDDPRLYAERSAVPDLFGSTLPLLIAVAELDPPQFVSQAVALVTGLYQARGRLPRFIRLSGHNHASIVQHIGAVETNLTAEIADFIASGR